MTSNTAPSLIQELDARQSDVLQQLDQLNARVEALLAQCTDRSEDAESRVTS